MTPTGLPQKGDVLVHAESGRRLEVVKREGSDALYSLILRTQDGSRPTRHSTPPYGYPSSHMRLLEAGYWIGQGTWRVVES
jgi:hypothetical protein